jgi:uncharacterized membrane protein
MKDERRLAAEIAQLDAVERRIIERFIHRTRVARARAQAAPTFGERVADRVAAFGGSWPFIVLSCVAIAAWVLINASLKKAFDPYPYILLNLVLSCLAALQAPVIMMSQNRQAARDRMDAQHDYEVNTQAELEIVGLHAKLDEIREHKWADLLKLQNQQLELLARLSSPRLTAAGTAEDG